MKTLTCKTCLFITFIVCSFEVTAQIDSLKIDSLKKVLLTEKEDTNKVKTLTSLSKVLLRNKNSAQLQVVNQEALALATKLNYEDGLGNIYKVFGDDYYYDQLNNIKALNNFYEALKHYEKGADKLNVNRILHRISQVYESENNYEAALKYALSALKISKEINDSIRMAGDLSTIGYIYAELDRYKESEACLNASAHLYHKLGDKNFPVGLIANLEELGMLYNKERSAALSAGNASLSQKLFAQSEHNYTAALKIADSIKDQYCIKEVNLSLGVFYANTKNYGKAKDFLVRGLNITKELGNPQFLPDDYKSLATADSALGNYKEAYKNYQTYIQYRDSLANINAQEQSLQTSFQYDFDKKQAIAKAAQDKKDAEAGRIKNKQYFIISALGIIVLAVIIIAAIQFRNNKQKQKANNLITQQKQQVETTLSELKSTQAQLIQSEKMASLGELTAGIAHEIQNPLNFVNNFSEVNRELVDEISNENDIEDIKAIANDIKQNSEKILFHGKRADAIIKGMLQHSRQTSGMKEPTDINALCDEYLRLSYHGLRAKDKSFNADFKTDFDASIGKIDIVPQDIGRVLLNLFNNAFYATNSKQKTVDENYKPLVLIQTKRINDKVEIKVSDNGNGIPSSIKDKIFQPFFTTKPTGEGTGLGLSLSYDIITKEHNGSIKVESKEGEGSMFIIELPA